MPEIPDIEVFSRNLKKLLVGKQVTKVKVANGKKLKDSAKELSQALEGQKILDVFRSGKELRIQFSKNVLLGHSPHAHRRPAFSRRAQRTKINHYRAGI
jgi:formamidopyrimidine-DNA glycosylase